ncbi:hypothetical protein [Allokutzneria sp. NRRL B-24872]|uniref:hypothetical protein n=1 Tax=Allokutzneria sp. NRRL B-24872 TaxID=1137961 RepID=UPI0011783CDC|nr:hypothetical protein [Allokutzneria sp. NRRL B-24872]
MNDVPVDVHPELLDPKWQRAALRRAKAEVRRSRRRRSRGKTVAALIAVVAVAAVSYLYFDGRLDGLLTSTTRDPAKPFLGTAAAAWADGAAGFAAPSTTPVGTYTGDQVAAATEQVRKLLITSRLDRRVIEGHDARPVLDLLAPDASKSVQPTLKPGTGGSPRWLHASIAKESRLAPAEPKVNGITTVGLAEDGALRVTAKYLIAYAFEAPGISDPEDAVATERLEINYEVRTGVQWRKGERGVWIVKSPGVVAYAYRCKPWNDGFLAPSLGSAPSGGRGDKLSFFDLNTPLTTYGICSV